MSKPNYYLTLDLMPGASHNEILHAYNRAKTTYTNGSLAAYSLLEGDDSNSILDEIEQAFATLGNPSKRREYDMEMGFKTWADEEDSRAARDNVTPLASIRSGRTTVNGARTTTFEDAGGDSAEIEKEIEAEASVARSSVVPIKAKNTPAPAPASSAPAANERLIGVQFEPNPDFEKKIAECVEVDGAFLKAVRIYRCYSVEGLAHRCKLSASHIMAIENEDSGSLHQPVYLRGHLYLITHALDMPNPDNLAKKFVDRMAAEGKINKRVF